MQRRQFSGGMKKNNLHASAGSTDTPVRAGFLLLEHFSLPAFTQALDALVTANLLRAGLFSSRTFGVDDAQVLSDLGLVIRPDAVFEKGCLDGLDILFVCGGYRTELKASEQLVNCCVPPARPASPWRDCGTGPGFWAAPACCKAIAAPSTPSIDPRWRRWPARHRSPASLLSLIATG